MKKLPCRCGIILLLLAPLGSAQAVDFVNQPLNPTLSGEFSNLGASSQQVAESIVLTQAVTVRSMSWSGRYGIAQNLVSPVDFSIRIFADSAGVPQTTPIQEWNVSAAVTPTGSDFALGVPWQSYTADVQPLVIGPGTFWISIVENDFRTTISGNTQWLWGDTSTFGTGAGRSMDATAWSANPSNSLHALTVSDTAQNTPTQVSFSTTVTNASGPFASTFTPGDVVIISYDLDTNVLDTNGAANAGIFPGATQSLTFEFPDLGLTIDFSQGNVQTFDNTANPDDQVFIFANVNQNGSMLGGESILQSEFDYIGTTSMLSSDALPTSILSDIIDIFSFFETSSGFTEVTFSPQITSTTSPTVPGDDCTATAGGCNPTGGQEIILPANFVVPPGGTITQTPVSFVDPRADANGRCDGQTPLVLFDGDLIIPPQFCASSEFVVLVTEVNFEILEGTVESRMFPEVFVNNPLGCDRPIIGDPQLQDIVIWQPDDSAEVIEGRALEVTDGCGSSRGRTRRLSFFVVGMHIDFGLDFNSDPQDVTQAFIDFTSAKIDSLVQAVENAEPALENKDKGKKKKKKKKKDNDFDKLKKEARDIQKKFDKGQYDKASRKLESFLKRAERAEFDTDIGFNHQGNLISRASNIKFTIDEKIIPFAN